VAAPIDGRPLLDCARRKEGTMTPRRGRRCIVAAAALALGVAGWTRVAAQDEPPPQVKTAPAVGFVGIEGRYTYLAYCAVCHGPGGHGNGPAAPALKIPVPDLTTIAKRYGTFDRLVVERRIFGNDQMPIAHGTMTMPIWGPVFQATGDRHTTILRLSNLVQYLEEQQVRKDARD
jgi:mono/diheme cytochrome c family protein